MVQARPEVPLPERAARGPDDGAGGQQVAEGVPEGAPEGCWGRDRGGGGGSFGRLNKQVLCCEEGAGAYKGGSAHGRVL